MARKIAACRRFESQSNCSLTIIGEVDEVVAAAAQHAAAVRDHSDSTDLRAQLRGSLEPEARYTARERAAEPFPW